MAGIFKAYDVRGTYPQEVNEDVAYIIGLGLAQEVFSGAGPIVVSRDMRVHSQPLCAALIRGLREGGCSVLEIGLAATPMNYWANATYRAAGSVTVTASHNPAQYNGFKVSGPGAIPIDYAAGLDRVEQFVQGYQQEGANSQKESPPAQGALQQEDQEQVLQNYLAFMRGFMPATGRPMKIAIDAANGMAGYFLEKFFAYFPWIQTVPLYWELDGSFPNHEADPIKAKNLADLQKVVRENGCDFGVGFDGDADRAVFVDERGEIIPSDLTTALIAERYLNEFPGTAILYDLRSSAVLPEVIQAAGGRPMRSRVGHSFMKRLLKKEGGKFGGELSGHFYFAECFDTDSALMALVKVIEVWQRTEGNPLSGLIQKYRKYFPTGEISFRVADIPSILRKIKERYADLEQDELDGLTVQGADWWFNLRASNTEPLLRLNLEAHQIDRRDQKLKELTELIERG